MAAASSSRSPEKATAYSGVRAMFANRPSTATTPIPTATRTVFWVLLSRPQTPCASRSSGEMGAGSRFDID